MAGFFTVTPEGVATYLAGIAGSHLLGEAIHRLREGRHDRIFTHGYDEGYRAGDEAGYTRGYGEGFGIGDEAGYTRGHATGYKLGDEAGYARGFDAGSETGYMRGSADGYSAGYAAGFRDGANCVRVSLIPLMTFD